MPPKPLKRSAVFDVTRERIRQIQVRAIKKLRFYSNIKKRKDLIKRITIAGDPDYSGERIVNPSVDAA